MRLVSFALSALVVGVGAGPVSAQLRANRPPPRTQNLPRLLVANPFPANSADSAAAVRIGDGMRKKMEDVSGRWFNTVTRQQMNEALLQYAYPADAVLPPPVARTLASQLQARFIVASTLSRAEGGRYAMQVRAIGMNDKAGFTATMVQEANQSLEAFGEKSAESLQGTFRALEDARKCWDQQTTKPRDAVESARNALRDQPDHGLAEFCLAEIAKAQQHPRDSVITHYSNVTKGDPQSLEAWGNLANLYHEAGDSANTVTAFQEMLRVAPTNQALREEAFRLFLQYGRPEAAKQVAEEGLAIDPSNADLWDLKSNACLFLEDFTCAVDALEQVFAVDSAKADSSFYNKISVSASQQPDTARLLRWASQGVRKYPDNAVLLSHLVTAYSYAGPVDSAMSAVRRLMAVDSTDLRPVLRTIQSLAAEKRYDDVQAMGTYVERLGEADDKQSLGLILLNGALPLLQQQPQDLDGAADLARKARELAVPGGSLAVQSNYILGLALAIKIPQLDGPIQEQKSCELARQSQTILDEANAALTTGQPANPDAIARYQQIVDGYRPRIESQVRAYCQ